MCPSVEGRAQVRARLDAVHRVGVTFPFDDHVAVEVGIEDVAPRLEPMALPVAHEIVDEAFARVDDVGDLGLVEDALTNDVALGREGAAFGPGEMPTGNRLHRVRTVRPRLLVHKRPWFVQEASTETAQPVASSAPEG